MHETPFHSFIELITFDQAIQVLEKQYEDLERAIGGHRDREQRLQSEQEAAKRVWVQAKKEVDDKELEAQTLEQKEQAKKKRIESVTNHREYQSLKAELDTIRDQQQALEKELLDAWHALEQAAKQYEVKKNSIAAEIALSQVEIKKQDEQRIQLADRIAKQQALRPEKEQQVPAEWLEKYAAMRARVADPVVPVIDGHCSACVYKVSPQDMIMLTRNKLLQCKDCYRFLYLPSQYTLQSEKKS
jgi:predicted  nucleic acid-binding Zn-ribbon protein